MPLRASSLASSLASSVRSARTSAPSSSVAPLESGGPLADSATDSRAASAPAAPSAVASTEVRPKSRRHFSRAEKLRILEAADACVKSGELGALLRREGIYSSHLAQWRRQREQGGLAALEPKKRGPAPDPDSPVRRRLREVERDYAKLAKRLETAELIIEVQKKLSTLLGIPLAALPEGGPS